MHHKSNGYALDSRVPLIRFHWAAAWSNCVHMLSNRFITTSFSRRDRLLEIAIPNSKVIRRLKKSGSRTVSVSNSVSVHRSSVRFRFMVLVFIQFLSSFGFGSVSVHFLLSFGLAPGNAFNTSLLMHHDRREQESKNTPPPSTPINVLRINSTVPYTNTFLHGQPSCVGP